MLDVWSARSKRFKAPSRGIQQTIERTLTLVSSCTSPTFNFSSLLMKSGPIGLSYRWEEKSGFLKCSSGPLENPKLLSSLSEKLSGGAVCRGDCDRILRRRGLRVPPRAGWSPWIWSSAEALPGKSLLAGRCRLQIEPRLWTQKDKEIR